MNDMTAVIVPKSDQISADDFIAGPQTYTIEAVDVRPGTEQPVNIHLAGEERAWRPCKSMSRVLVAAWGPDSAKYKGKSLTLYRDPKVKWGGMEIGGIRVSHLSDIDREMLLQLTATKGKRAPHIVKPLQAQPATFSRSPHEEDSKEQVALHQRTEAWATKYIGALQDAVTDDELKGIRQRQTEKLAWVRDNLPTIYQRVIEADPASAQPAPAANQSSDEAAAESREVVS